MIFITLVIQRYSKTQILINSPFPYNFLRFTKISTREFPRHKPSINNLLMPNEIKETFGEHISN